MILAAIREQPTTIGTGPNSGRVHESVLRSFHIVGKVRELLNSGTPPDIVLEIIDDLMNAPHATHEMDASQPVWSHVEVQMAHRIAGDLFTNGCGKVGTRLVLVDENNTDLGGWSQPAVIDRVRKQLTR